ncbi:MAG TPA: class I SAM-dependent methyltransferase [Candidatus Hydrogenedentes bacterium]|nr:class I SAM-dependent methyltransferase [Candidatus Hydrogenedentota bacterium]
MSGFDYDRVAARYDRHRSGGGPYFPRLTALADGCGATRVLEVGAGTGNETVLFLQAHPCALTALEPSANMLEAGRAKGLPVRWVRGAAPALPFQDGAFNFLFASYVLHHVRDLGPFLSECARVLACGCAAFVTVSQAFIHGHVMNAYFPSLAVIDAARFQPIPEVEAAMRAAGFRDVASEDSTSPPRIIDAEYIEKIADHFISTYALLPEDEFAKGLARLREDVFLRGKRISMVREATLVWGFR